MDPKLDQGVGSPGKTAVTVLHGHLAFASHPVLVGHYEGDAFSGSEAQLDRALGLQLTARRQLGLYPGAIGTAIVVLDGVAKPPGAVVAGLGHAPEMAAGLLRQALRHAMLVYAVANGHASDDLTLSVLAVGSGEGGVNLPTGVIAMLQAAIEAQRALDLMGSKDLPHRRFVALEFVELFEQRALSIWNAARDAIEERPEYSSAFALAETVEQRPGGRGRSPPGRDPSWWQPVTIRMLGDDRVERSLQFEFSDGRARAERLVLPADLDFVEPLVNRAIQHIDLETAATSAGRILFELLLPPALRDRSVEERNRRLILDPRSASLPWELLDDRRDWPAKPGGDQLRPPAVRAGLVRQLLEGAGPDRTRLPQQGTALVIGDPRAMPMDGFVLLKGARDEAEAVADLLKTKGYDVRRLIGDKVTPDQVCRNLFSRDWEIIHIAAHGVVASVLPGPDGTMRKVTGIVLGGGVVLGPSVLSKLPASPNVVFVNCCHLGNIDSAAEEQSMLGAASGRPELAASVAVQLIRSGARCVVAAGWAVDDDKARDFAQTFYAQMLAGSGFGEATLAARRGAFTPGADSNTWGAYQCYGDPDYRLRSLAPAAAVARVEVFGLVQEAIEAADQIREDLNIGLERAAAPALRTRLAGIVAQAEQKRWLSNPALRTALGRAYAAVGEHDTAIAHYEAAVAAPNGRAPVVAFEQLNNLRMRRSFRRARDATPQGRLAAATEIEAARTDLAKLTDLFGQTGERLALQAGCCKRLAQLAQISGQPDRARAQLKQMAQLYGNAAAVEVSCQAARWQRLMQAVAELSLILLEAGDPAELCAGLEPLTRAPPVDADDFWALISACDALTLSMIASRRFEDWSAIRSRYRAAWAHVGSQWQLDSVLEQLDFHRDVLGPPDCLTETERGALAARLDEIRADLKMMTQESIVE